MKFTTSTGVPENLVGYIGAKRDIRNDETWYRWFWEQKVISWLIFN